MAEFKIDDTVDITTVVCPTTFVKAKVALEELDDGQILSIRMNDGEPVQNVPAFSYLSCPVKHCVIRTVREDCKRLLSALLSRSMTDMDIL